MKYLAAVILIAALFAIVLVVWTNSNSGQHPHFSPIPTTAASPTVSITPSPLAANPCVVNHQVYCVLNPAVTQKTISTTICVVGWTSTIRPPTSYTNPLKASQLALYASLHQGDKSWTMSGTEEDHRVPLELGGAPSDPSNLSPEDHPGSFSKDKAENQAKSDVCSGRKTLEQAQTDFITLYLSAYPGYTRAG